MCTPALILRQDTQTPEGRVVGQACMLMDITQKVVSLDSLRHHASDLAAGALPVGSVEFVREAMRVAGLTEPAPMSYPMELDELLGRRVEPMPLERVRGTCFVKPVQTKLFTGFVWHASAPDSDYTEHDLEQLQALRSLPSATMVWVSSPVAFQCEWRYYVLEGSIIGAARYDPDGADDAPSPDGDTLRCAIQAMASMPSAPAAYALDVGVLACGRTVLVEVNDAWAIGHYARSVTPQDYLRLLATRWRQIARPELEADLKPTPASRRAPKAG